MKYKMTQIVYMYQQTANISDILLGNKIVNRSDVQQMRLSALLQLHFHSRLQDETRNV